MEAIIVSVEMLAVKIATQLASLQIYVSTSTSPHNIYNQITNQVHTGEKFYMNYDLEFHNAPLNHRQDKTEPLDKT